MAQNKTKSNGGSGLAEQDSPPPKIWQRTDFQFDLPAELIAQYPTSEREASRLLVVSPAKQRLQDKLFTDFIDYLNPGDLLIMNDTRVIPARLLGRKETGGKVEVLVERVLDNKKALAHVRSSKSPKAETELILEESLHVTVLGREDDLFLLKFKLSENETVLSALEQYGHIPLPPYIERQDNLDDRERYQTVYANKPGAAAAPTAGLHFTRDILDKIAAKGISIATVTLHVGAGTFQPVRVDNLQDHQMHSEWISLSNTVAKQINETKQKGARVVAIGTTSVRCLESAFAYHGSLQAYTGETDIFITPGFKFNVVDALFTNFHLSESTLIMLVSAFAGYDNTMGAYQHAVEKQYRFFSYGDAMFITTSATY
ncbi:S-adenosylmethionine:tRNA ribosyltransferase-isomerase [hydrothermal vent metagenome]|uniref:S-adenosylmethionine:tRNA ribosyltransferase-isomerase n=1 Tax=hydrothermal vent metagenome TaxID=652676 RepID=A0A3B1A0N2_9ZZZZ